ncbi:MAG: FtsX-like permease family protein [Coriobacteriales bacterium]|jgi:putative ABC transport system permease protein|nr:FtsX-like permease family protein [Coriobacteriales bacterium]
MRSGGILSGAKDILAERKARFAFSSLGIVLGIASAVVRSTLDGVLPAILKANTVSNFLVLPAGEFEQAAEAVAVWRLALAIAMILFLLIGGMSILNAMLFTVEGSADEIRMRRAVGARPSDIVGLFLLPPLAVCLIAGVVGIVLGALGSFGLTAFMGTDQLLEGFVPVVRVGTLAESLLLCLSLGLATGLYPANRAAKKSQEFL